MNERIAWQHRHTGQHYVTQTGVDPTTHQPFEITRPVYPDEPVAIHPPLAAAEKAAMPEAPVRPAEGVSVNSDTPRAIASAARMAHLYGWDVRVTRSAGPRNPGDADQSFIYAVRADKPGRRVIMCWRWHAATEKTPAHWGSDINWCLPDWRLKSSTEAKEELSR